MQGIYYIENIINQRRYYGSSFNLNKRLKQHQSDLKNGTHCNIHLQRTYNKHGDIFRYEILEETNFDTRRDLLDYEQEFLDKNKNGYNIAPANGGDTMARHPNKGQIVEKIKQTTIKNMKNLSPIERQRKFGNYGDRNGNWKNGSSIKHCPKCSNAMGYYAETCGSCRDRTKEKNPFYGKDHTEKTKAILREKLSGDNSWISGIDPKELSYTKQYIIEYTDGSIKEVCGLKIIAEEFNTSIANLHATMGRMKRGKIPARGTFKGINIYEKKCHR